MKISFALTMISAIFAIGAPMLVSQLQYIGPILILFGIGLMFVGSSTLQSQGLDLEKDAEIVRQSKVIKTAKFIFFAGITLTIVWLLFG
jgi:hypothetical protein